MTGSDSESSSLKYKSFRAFAQKCTHLRRARRAVILYPEEKREMMHCRRKSSFRRPEQLCGALTYCTAYTVRMPRKNSRLPGTQEGPSHSLRQADPKNGRHLFNATEPVRVRLQQLQISCPEPTFRALFPFRLADTLQFLSSLRRLRLRLRLWAAPSSRISRTSSRSKPHSASPHLHHDRPSQPSICSCPAQGQPSLPGCFC